MTQKSPLKMGAATLLATLSLLLTGCFINPGKFESELVLMDENEFSFTYEGEIVFVGLTDLAALGEDEFEAKCYDDRTGESRDCTQIEIDDQRANWEVDQQMKAQKDKKQAEQMSALMGDIDPTDPEAAEELRRLLLRQKGWERVEITDKGVFNVTYRMTGTLGHDFMFPVIEGMPSTNPFVQVYVRDDNVVRVNAPGFGEGNEMAGMMGAMGAPGLINMGKADKDGADAGSELPTPEGTFTIVTNGKIRANNTDEGANPFPQGELLEWDISSRTKAAPTALIDLSR